MCSCDLRNAHTPQVWPRSAGVRVFRVAYTWPWLRIPPRQSGRLIVSLFCSFRPVLRPSRCYSARCVTWPFRPPSANRRGCRSSRTLGTLGWGSSAPTTAASVGSCVRRRVVAEVPVPWFARWWWWFAVRSADCGKLVTFGTKVLRAAFSVLRQGVICPPFLSDKYHCSRRTFP